LYSRASDCTNTATECWAKKGHATLQHNTYSGKTFGTPLSCPLSKTNLIACIYIIFRTLRLTITGSRTTKPWLLSCSASSKAVRRTAMRLRQLHVDNSIVEITRQQNSWQVQLVIPRDDGTRLNLVGIQTGTLDEAKEIASRAMRHENPKHTCSPVCSEWVEISNAAASS
jgi:hypothetical protein